MTTQACTVARNLVIEQGSAADYGALGRFHYRDAPPRPYAAIFVLRHRKSVGRMPATRGLMGKTPMTRMHTAPVGVIVYVNPPANHAARNAATGRVVCRIRDRGMQLRLINRNIRTIARVIIDPRYRGLGLAARLVRESMPLLDVAMIEAAAAMGHVRTFFERAGMRRFAAASSFAAAQCDRALRAAGIRPEDYVDARSVQRKLDALPAPAAQPVDAAFRRLLKPCVKRRQMAPGVERTRFVLSRLGPAPAYYLWFNPRKPPDWMPTQTGPALPTPAPELSEVERAAILEAPARTKGLPVPMDAADSNTDMPN